MRIAYERNTGDLSSSKSVDLGRGRGSVRDIFNSKASPQGLNQAPSSTPLQKIMGNDVYAKTIAPHMHNVAHVKAETLKVDPNTATNITPQKDALAGVSQQVNAAENALNEVSTTAGEVARNAIDTVAIEHGYDSVAHTFMNNGQSIAPELVKHGVEHVAGAGAAMLMSANTIKSDISAPTSADIDRFAEQALRTLQHDQEMQKEHSQVSGAPGQATPDSDQNQFDWSDVTLEEFKAIAAEQHPEKEQVAQVKHDLEIVAATHQEFEDKKPEREVIAAKKGDIAELDELTGDSSKTTELLFAEHYDATDVDILSEGLKVSGTPVVNLPVVDQGSAEAVKATLQNEPDPALYVDYKAKYTYAAPAA